MAGKTIGGARSAAITTAALALSRIVRPPRRTVRPLIVSINT